MYSLLLLHTTWPKHFFRKVSTASFGAILGLEQVHTFRQKSSPHERQQSLIAIFFIQRWYRLCHNSSLSFVARVGPTSAPCLFLSSFWGPKLDHTLHRIWSQKALQTPREDLRARFSFLTGWYRSNNECSLSFAAAGAMPWKRQLDLVRLNENHTI